MVPPGLERRSPTKFDGSGTAIHRYHLSVSQPERRASGRVHGWDTVLAGDE
jgi:hypothetical protein